MIIDKVIILNIKGSKSVSKLKEIGIECKIGDIVKIPIEKMWKGSNIKINVKCDICGHEKKLRYTDYLLNLKHNLYCCSNKCAVEKSKITNLDKYGVENVFQNEEIKNKIKETNLEKYGCEYSAQNTEIKEKIKQTNLEKYGVHTTLLEEKTIKKIKQTNLEKYGDIYPICTKEIRNKAENTKYEKYGDKNYNNRDKYIRTCLEKYSKDSTNKVDEIKEKKIKSHLKKYGVINNSMTEECKNKLRQTNLERYGVEYPMQVEEFFYKQQKSSLKIKKYKDTDLYYQGTYELDFLNYCEDNNILSIVERGKTINYMFENKNKIYYPDFFIDEMNLIIEIKSSYFYKKYEDKNISKKNKCLELGYNYIMILDKKYNFFEYYITLINDSI